jgi:hypothetical protein
MIRKLFTVDVRSLAAFRIALGLVLLSELFERAKQIGAHYTDAGVLPRWANAEYFGWSWSPIHSLSGSLAYEQFLFLVHALVYVGFVLGWRTRLMAILSYVFLFSLQHRNPMLLQEGDTLGRHLLLWMCFVPCGDVWSLDARRRGPSPAPVLSFGAALLMLQPVFVYVVAAISKLESPSWREGRAIYAVLHKPSYVQGIGHWVAEQSWAWAPLDYGTLVVEASLPFLLFFPWRTQTARIVAFFVNLLFQVGLALCLRISLFQPLSVAMLVVYLGPSFWDRWFPLASATRAWTLRARAWDAVAAAHLLLVAIVNVRALDREPPVMHGPVDSIVERLQLWQSWRVFANTDGTHQGWYVAWGTTAAGERIDLATGTSPPSFELPADFSHELPNLQWQTYWIYATRKGLEPALPLLADYFCDTWNRRAPLARRAIDVAITYMDVDDFDPRIEPTVTRRDLLSGHCPG